MIMERATTKACLSVGLVTFGISCPLTHGASLQENRDRLFKTYLGRSGDSPSEVEDCHRWNQLTPEQKAQWLTQTHRLQNAMLKIDNGTPIPLLDEVTKIDHILGSAKTGDRCRSEKANRMFFRVSDQLRLALIMLSGQCMSCRPPDACPPNGTPQSERVQFCRHQESRYTIEEGEGRRWVQTKDPNAHGPYTWSTESTGGRPTAQLQLFQSPPDGCDPDERPDDCEPFNDGVCPNKPAALELLGSIFMGAGRGRQKLNCCQWHIATKDGCFRADPSLGIFLPGDLRSVEMDHDIDSSHKSGMTCDYNGKSGLERYGLEIGDFGCGWVPEGCATLETHEGREPVRFSDCEAEGLPDSERETCRKQAVKDCHGTAVDECEVLCRQEGLPRGQGTMCETGDGTHGVKNCRIDGRTGFKCEEECAGGCVCLCPCVESPVKNFLDSSVSCADLNCSSICGVCEGIECDPDVDVGQGLLRRCEGVADPFEELDGEIQCFGGACFDRMKPDGTRELGCICSCVCVHVIHARPPALERDE